MTREELKARLADDEIVAFLEPAEFDVAIIGLASRCGEPRKVAYDYDRVIDILTVDGTTREEAEEFFDINIIGAWMGETTPVFIEK